MQQPAFVATILPAVRAAACNCMTCHACDSPPSPLRMIACSVDAYNKLLAQLGAGSSDEDEDSNAQGQQAPQTPPLSIEGSEGGASFGVPLAARGLEDEEEDGALDVLQSVLGVLAAFGVELPLGSHTSPEWLCTVLGALDKLAQQG